MGLSLLALPREVKVVAGRPQMVLADQNLRGTETTAEGLAGQSRFHSQDYGPTRWSG